MPLSPRVGPGQWAQICPPPPPPHLGSRYPGQDLKVCAWSLGSPFLPRSPLGMGSKPSVPVHGTPSALRPGSCWCGFLPSAPAASPTHHEHRLWRGASSSQQSCTHGRARSPGTLARRFSSLRFSLSFFPILGHPSCASSRLCAQGPLLLSMGTIWRAGDRTQFSCIQGKHAAHCAVSLAPASRYLGELSKFSCTHEDRQL